MGLNKANKAKWRLKTGTNNGTTLAEELSSIDPLSSLSTGTSGGVSVGTLGGHSDGTSDEASSDGGVSKAPKMGGSHGSHGEHSGGMEGDKIHEQVESHCSGDTSSCANNAGSDGTATGSEGKGNGGGTLTGSDGNHGIASGNEGKGTGSGTITDSESTISGITTGSEGTTSSNGTTTSTSKHKKRLPH